MAASTPGLQTDGGVAVVESLVDLAFVDMDGASQLVGPCGGGIAPHRLVVIGDGMIGVALRRIRFPPHDKSKVGLLGIAFDGLGKRADRQIEVAIVEIFEGTGGVRRSVAGIEANGLVVIGQSAIPFTPRRIGAAAAVISPPEIRIDPYRGAAILEGAILVPLDVPGFATQLVSNRVGRISRNDLGLFGDDAVVGRIVSMNGNRHGNGDRAKQTENPADRTAIHGSKTPHPKPRRDAPPGDGRIRRRNIAAPGCENKSQTAGLRFERVSAASAVSPGVAQDALAGVAAREVRELTFKRRCRGPAVQPLPFH